MEKEFEGQRDGEEVVYVFRRHIVTAVRGLWFMLGMTGFGVVPMLIWPNDGRMIAVWIGCIVIGGLGLAYSLILWFFSYYLITSERLRQTRQKGLFNKTVVDLDLINIQSASFGVSGVLGSMLDYGTILVQTGAGDLVLSMVSHPEKVYNELQDAVHKANQEKK
ncbi:PH domain-containing protein [Candidatus Saccharibacteria bacterium]|nr:PH domain-containing protein [Candidatus Saccharibacteria bacterium]